MEQPYAGRAIINNQFDHTEIIIPIQKNWLIVAFLSFWMCGWVFGEISALKTIIQSKGISDIDLFTLVWVCGWTVGGIFAVRMLIWMAAGKDIIEIGYGTLKVSKNAALFVKPKVYDLNECKNFRVKEEDWFRLGSGRSGNAFNVSDMGTIRFDYGMKTIKFGAGLDEAEALHILKKLKDGKLLTDRNFAA